MLPRRAAERLLLALAVLAAVHDVAYSYPTLWADLNLGCSDHPTKQEGEHKAPVPDSATKFLVTDAGVPIKELCPGLPYGVKVTFPEPRLGLLSVSVGSFVPEDPVCPDRVVELKTERSTSLDATLSVPCDAKGPVVMRVTSAVGSSGAFQDARATVPINPACAAATCAVDTPIAAAATKAVLASPAVVPAAAAAKPAVVPPAAAAKPAVLPAAAAAVAPAAAVAAKPAAAAAKPAVTATAAAPARPASLVTRSPVVPGCRSSTLWYSCAVGVRGGGTIHYSIGPSPPDNVCTQRAGGSAPDAAGQDMLHMALEGGEAGYASLGFTAAPGMMCPSDVVIGSVSPDGKASIASYNLQDYAVSAADETKGWASNMGVVQIGGKTVICFSRPLETSAAKSTPKLDDAAAQIIWAASPETAFEKHTLWGSFTPDLRPLLAIAKGAPAADVAALAARAAPLSLVATDPMEIIQRNNVISQVHGALMLLAFLVLMPIGALLARHKWLFGDDDEDGMVDPGWYYLHIFVQVMAILTAIAGTVLIMGWFGLNRKSINPLYLPHMALGLASTSAGIVQGIIGASRPPLAARQRATWRGVHYGWGWLTMLAGIANSGIGIALIHIIHSNKLAYWIGPTVAAAAALAIVAFGLEVKRSQLISSGVFIPKEHAMVKPKYKAPANGGGYGAGYVASDAAASGVPHV